MLTKLPPRLREDIQAGRVVLVLGAGCSVTSTNSARREIIGSTALAQKLASRAGLSYDNDSLRDVFEATRDLIGDAELQRIFEAEFTNCVPSKELSGLFSYPWRRIYTLNIDDSVKSIPRKSRVQELKFYNSLKDRREEWIGYDHCQVIFLHGHANDFSSGFIFSESEYARFSTKRHPWYEKLGEDFFDCPIVFIGTNLDEPLFLHHVNAANQSYRAAGRAYLITPSDFSEIRLRALQTKNIEHIQATLMDFVHALESEFPDGLTPRDIETASGTPASELHGDLNRFTRKDIEALRCLFHIDRKKIAERFKSSQNYMRRFYEGFGPTWPVILERGYADLRQYNDIYKTHL